MRIVRQQGMSAAAEWPGADAKDGGTATFLVREERRHAGGRKLPGAALRQAQPAQAHCWQIAHLTRPCRCGWVDGQARSGKAGRKHKLAKASYLPRSLWKNGIWAVTTPRTAEARRWGTPTIAHVELTQKQGSLPIMPHVLPFSADCQFWRPFCSQNAWCMLMARIARWKPLQGRMIALLCGTECRLRS